MNTMRNLEQKLQKADRKQAVLYLTCNFVSLMLISAYSSLLFSPTVLTVFPEGGDSRKQVMMIFILAVFGCGVFTVYSAGLFFRKKSRQIGILMSMGASRRRLAPGLFREVLILSCTSSLAGILAGFPFVWILWNAFRQLIIDSAEMKLRIDFRYLWISFIFFIGVVACSCIMAFVYLRKTNIMDVIHEEHKNEPVHELGRWCGPEGIPLLLLGAAAGYYAPTIYMRLFSAYPPVWVNIAYAPVFVGLYMIMLHTVVYGWGFNRKNPYKNIISRSMMKFQGKQTVNNLLVVTVLIAGAAFAIFYTPMIGTGQLIENKQRPYDYYFHSRADQDVPSQEEIISLAEEYGITLTDFKNGGFISLALDGTAEVEEADNSFHYEYKPLLEEGRFLSESTYQDLTGQTLDVQPGTYLVVSNEDETGLYFQNSGSTKLTNMITFKELPTEFAGYVHFGIFAGATGYYVLDDSDYQMISEGLTPDWKGNIQLFNVAGEDSYPFANALFHAFVQSFGPECEFIYAYDRVSKYAKEQEGEIYWGDTDSMEKISYSQPDSTDFRSYWMYMPKIRILDKNDFIRTFAVFLMVFLFITIVCSMTAMIICFTRCQTIAINNRYVFDDLKRLGASPEFLQQEVKNQCGRIFKVPVIVGMTAMYLLYGMIMYANDNSFTFSELAGMGACLAVMLLLALIIYFVWRITLRSVRKELGV